MHISYLVLAVVLLLAGRAASAEPSGSFEDWTPAGWTLIASATGDLNADGAEDAVLVVEEADAANLLPHEGFGEPVLNLNPRRLIVLFSTPSGYREVLTRDHLLPSEHDQNIPCLADPLLSEGGVSINQGKLLIQLGIWLSCGSYDISRQTFTFRFDEKGFRLIGYDHFRSSRSAGEVSEYSVNYLTGKKKTTTGGNLFEDTTPSVAWSRISNGGKFYLQEMSLQCYAGDEPGCNWRVDL